MTKGFLDLCAVLILLLISPGVLHADPLFTSPRTMPDGTVLYHDASHGNVYYYVPEGVELEGEKSDPHFFFYKYIGTRSADFNVASGTSTAGGRVSLALGLVYPAREKRNQWKEMLGRSAELRPMPVDRMVLHLLLTDVPGDEGGKRELSTRTAPGGTRSFNVGVSAKSTTLLWDALEVKGNVAVMGDVELHAAGYELQNKEGGGQEYVTAERIHRISTALPVSREEHPGKFRIIDLHEKVSFHYRDLTVFCFDFVDGLTPDLDMIVVEVSVQTPRGQKDRKSVTFTGSSDPELKLKFNVPEQKGGNYSYRVTRVMKDGRRSPGDWLSGDNALLDVTHYEIEGEYAQ